jgi:hypothetical protein
VKITQEFKIGYLEKLKLHYLEIPREVLLKLNDGNENGKFNQRVLITAGEKLKWQGGIVALGEGSGYITFSKSRMKTLNLHEGETVVCTIEKDNSEYGHEFPIEFQEVLAQDPEAKDRFDKLSPGKQRTIIYYINQVRSSDKKIERSLFFMTNLKNCPEGKETMRILFGKE